jgi:hypothetical protein
MDTAKHPSKAKIPMGRLLLADDFSGGRAHY